MTTTTGTSTTTGAIQTATQQLLTSLNTGSGVDTSTLVTSLVTAEFAARSDALTSKASTLTTQISGVATLKSTITNFASAVDGLVGGGTLATQPVSSNPAALTATALPGAKLGGLSSAIVVSQLAGNQAARTTSAVASRSATIGSGSFTLSFGTASYSVDGTTMTGFTAGSAAPVTIDVTDASLDGIAAAVNASGAGVTASVVTDADGGAYLSLKGKSGATQAFTLAASNDPSGNLAQFAVGPGASGTALSATAQNAKLTVDGVAVERASNTIGDLVTGVNLQLAATSATAVSLTSTSPTSALSSAVTNFVDTYNQVLAAVQAQTDPATGVLKSDPAATALLHALKTLTSKVLLTGGNAETNGPTRLSELGVGTNKDGTLSVNAKTLARQLSTFPGSVEAMFSSGNTAGLGAALDTLSTGAISTVTGLGASTSRYTAAQATISTQQDKISTARDKEKTRLTQLYSAMNSKVAAYKSTQTFLTNQVAAWNKSDS
ncbi:flagellar filament capping protein FliD [Sphingomonas bacterium]|uniref:flagellar filament capping protein FliD n=1 Tax=Sphingomonas bacterium TaxID=1895847 RepID=UPI0015753C0A|nr:flagellar filament capping protein FliD [Sphingomonas bacterium]